MGGGGSHMGGGMGGQTIGVQGGGQGGMGMGAQSMMGMQQGMGGGSMMNGGMGGMGPTLSLLLIPRHPVLVSHVTVLVQPLTALARFLSGTVFPLALTGQVVGAASAVSQSP